MSFLDEAGDANPSGGHDYIKPGIYRFMIEEVKHVIGKGKESYVGVFRVLEARGKIDGVQPNAVNTTCNISFSSKHASTPSNIKALNVAVWGSLGWAADEVKAPQVKELCAKHNPGRGIVIDCETRQDVAKESKKELTLCSFKPVSGQTEASIKAGRAMLDAGDKTKADAAAAKAAPAEAPATPPAVSAGAGALLARLPGFGGPAV